MVLLQLKNPLELSEKRRDLIPVPSIILLQYYLGCLKLSNFTMPRLRMNLFNGFYKLKEVEAI